MHALKPRRQRKKRLIWRTGIILFILYFFPVGYKVAAHYSDPGRTASWSDLRRDSSKLAPDPATTSDAIIQVYSARAMRWRGALGVHTWIATKRTSEKHYTRLEVMGYALRWSGTTVRIRSGQPDSYWYGSRPQLLRELRGGVDIDNLIDKLHETASSYPYDHRYKIWPGPNSNTFIAYLARQVPELNLDLPPTAIGKDYLVEGSLFSEPPSGSGLQISMAGLLGVIIAPEEGLEMNLLGLTAGLDFSPLAIKLPGIGRLGYSDFKTFTVENNL
ncbi:MAG: DUF3750 domain-containing protein [bacterium]